MSAVCESNPAHPSRRAFLRAGLACAAGSAIASRAWPAPPLTAPPATKPALDDPFPRVLRVTSPGVVQGRYIDVPRLRDILKTGLCRLTDRARVEEAWQSLLRPDDVILLKFNQSGMSRLGITTPLVEDMLRSLEQAGFSPERIMVLEAGEDVPALARTRRPDVRYSGRTVQFGSCGSDSFLAALEEATAVINVPFLKSHHRTVLTCCLKNLSHGLIRHPARFHTNGCNPAIGQICGSEPIRSRLRLNVINALRVPFTGGADAVDAQIHMQQEVIFGLDPVACDAVAYGVLNEVRSLHRLGPALPRAALPPYLSAAGALGLGTFDMERIATEQIET